ncbi:MAG: sigma-70 family RNA polymerase sigma factor [Geminicoccaceae bacterium]
MSKFGNDLVGQLPQLRAFARALTGGDQAFADDLVQDTVVKALQAQDRFELGTNLKAWLFTILRNNFRSVMRSKRVKTQVSDDGLENLLWSAPAQEDRLEFQAFKRAFRQLSPAHREVLVLVCMNGYRYEKAAEICGCEVGTIRSRLNRARNQLRRMLLEGELPLDPVVGAARPMELHPTDEEAAPEAWISRDGATSLPVDRRRSLN